MRLEDIPVLQPAPHGPLPDPDAAARQLALRLGGVEKLTLVVNDPQRDTPTTCVLDRLAEALPRLRARVLVATGSHSFPAAQRASFEAALRASLTVEEFSWHNARSDELIPIGSWRGHRWLLDRDWPLLAIGSCEPHYFAGVTGAHKTVTIGCAAYEDIQANHAHALSPESRPCHLDGNPVHEGVAEMLRALQREIAGARQMTSIEPQGILAINLLVVAGEVRSAAVGDPLSALRALGPAVEQSFCRRIPQPADALVLHVSGALAESFYQADKAIKNSEWAVRDGGAIILCSACPNGVGQREFFDFLARCPDHACALLAVQREGYRLGWHKSIKLRYLTDVRRVRVFAVSSGLSDAETAVLHFRKAFSVEAALALAGVDLSHALYQVHDAGNTVVLA